MTTINVTLPTSKAGPQAIYTIEQYSTEKHRLFTHQLVKIGNRIVAVYKNNGYTHKSTIYGNIFEIDLKDRNIFKFKTKKQVVAYLSKLN